MEVMSGSHVAEMMMRRLELEGDSNGGARGTSDGSKNECKPCSVVATWLPPPQVTSQSAKNYMAHDSDGSMLSKPGYVLFIVAKSTGQPINCNSCSCMAQLKAGYKAAAKLNSMQGNSILKEK
jgi:hypothetical protein